MERFFTTKNEQIITNVPILRIYIPQDYIENGIATLDGSAINTLALFQLSAHNKETDNGVFKSCLFPVNMRILFNSFYQSSQNEIKELEKNQKYLVLQSFQDSVLLENNSLIGNHHSLYNLLQLLLNGKLPKIINYNNIIHVILNCIEINGMTSEFNLPYILLEALTSEFARNSQDINEPLRMKLGRIKKTLTEKDLSDFIYISSKNLPHIKSTFSSITFEDFFKSLTFSINRTRHNEKEASTPIEKLIHQ